MGLSSLFVDLDSNDFTLGDDDCLYQIHKCFEHLQRRPAAVLQSGFGIQHLTASDVNEPPHGVNDTLFRNL